MANNLFNENVQTINQPGSITINEAKKIITARYTVNTVKFPFTERVEDTGEIFYYSELKDAGAAPLKYVLLHSVVNNNFIIYTYNGYRYDFHRDGYNSLIYVMDIKTFELE